VDISSRTAANRRLLADFFDSLNAEQLRTPSLCDAWTVREVLGHLAMPFVAGVGAFLVQVVRSRGSINGASERVAAQLARRPVGELTGVLRANADQHVRAPGVGPMGQMTDGCVHLRDCARPLGLPDDVRMEDWRMVLDWLPSGVPGLVPKRRLEGLRLIATDQDWAWGSGEEVAGRSEAMALAITGREVALRDINGPGVELLRQRIEAGR
jgi:uncharacterized protein (TIGR03083 family)